MVEPKLCFFQNVPTDASAGFFRNQAARWARRINAVAAPNLTSCNTVGPAPYNTGAEILASLSAAFACLKGERIKEAHFFGHMYPEGVIGNGNLVGLYFRDPVSNDSKKAVDRSSGGRTVSDILPTILADDVVFVMHGCHTASGEINFARILFETLAMTLKTPRVFGHYISVCVGQDGFWREYSVRFPSGLKTSTIPVYQGGGCG